MKYFSRNKIYVGAGILVFGVIQLFHPNPQDYIGHVNFSDGHRTREAVERYNTDSIYGSSVDSALHVLQDELSDKSRRK